MSVILLNHEPVHYEVLGRGRPIVFLHGWVGSWRYWIPSMQVASAQYRAYAVDLWGFGDTAHKTERYSLDHQADLVEEFLDALGIGKIALVGHGLGAVVGLLLSQRRPEAVDRMLAISLPLQGAHISPRFKLGSPRELADWLLSENPDHEAARAEAPKADPLALQASLDGLDAVEISSMIEALPRSRLLVYGANDPALLPNGKYTSLELPPEAPMLEFSQSGHFPMLDERDQFNRLLLDFLALNNGDSPQILTIKEKWKRRVR